MSLCNTLLPAKGREGATAEMMGVGGVAKDNFFFFGNGLKVGGLIVDGLGPPFGPKASLSVGNGKGLLRPPLFNAHEVGRVGFNRGREKRRGVFALGSKSLALSREDYGDRCRSLCVANGCHGGDRSL